MLNLEDPDVLSKSAPTIGYNSNVYFSKSLGNLTLLFELFSFGLHLHKTTIQTKEVKNWMDIKNYLPSYALERRGDFLKTQLRGVTVVSNHFKAIKISMKKK